MRALAPVVLACGISTFGCGDEPSALPTKVGPSETSTSGGGGAVDTTTSPGDDEDDSAGWAGPRDIDDPWSGNPPVDSYADDIEPPFVFACVIYCHSSPLYEESLDLDWGAGYEGLVDKQAVQVEMLRVKPGDPDNSYLWHKLVDTHLDVGGDGVQMPKDRDPLTADIVANVKEWIEIGAPP